MKSIIILSCLLAIAFAQYTCNTYPTTAKPSFWTCTTAFNNGYVFLRSATSKSQKFNFEQC